MARSATLVAIVILGGFSAPARADDAVEVVKVYKALEISQSAQAVEVEATAVDLNADGIAEILGSLEGGAFCGTAGCDRFVLAHGADGWVEILHTVAQSLVPLPTTTAGVSDLKVNDRERWIWSGRTWHFRELLP